MSQSPAPAAPAPTAAQGAAAPAPPAPTVTVSTPTGPVPLQGLPTTPLEVQGLHERRDLLRDQLSRATNRRAELVNELETEPYRGAGDEVRAGLQQRLNVLDGRILELEQEQALTERLLSNADPAVLASTIEYPAPGTWVDDDQAALTAFGTFGLGVVLTLFVSRFWWRRKYARAGVPTSRALPAEDPRFERLTYAVDAIAEEVERIGEGQRFVTQLLAGRNGASALNAESERR